MTVCANPDLPDPAVEPQLSLTSPQTDFSLPDDSLDKVLSDMGDEAVDVVSMTTEPLTNRYGGFMSKPLEYDMVSENADIVARTVIKPGENPKLIFNEKYWTNDQILSKRLDDIRDSLAKYTDHVPHGTIGMIEDYGSGIITHEFGHYLWHTPQVGKKGITSKLSSSPKKKLIDGLNELAVGDGIEPIFKTGLAAGIKGGEQGDLFLRFVDDMTPAQRDWVKSNLSEYALDEETEFFAEAFAEYMGSFDSRREIAGLVGEWADETLGMKPLKKFSPPTPATIKKPMSVTLPGVSDETKKFFDNPAIRVNENTIDDFYERWDSQILDFPQSNAILEYQQGSGPFNRLLRNMEQSNERLTVDEVNELIADLDTTMKPLSKGLGEAFPDGILVHRGVSDNVAREWTAGDIYSDRGYMSTSINQESAEDFAGGEEGWMMFLYVPPTARGRYISTPDDLYEGEEYELLLARDTKFRIIEKNEEEKIMYVEVIP